MIGSITTALMMGFLGSIHCAAMCGPLAIGGCRSRRETSGYFAGRALTYSLFGAVFGSLGRSFSVDPIWTWLLAALALAYGLSVFRRPPDRTLVQLPRRFPLRFLARLIPRRGLGLGLATGALPCGLLASAWVLAASTGDALEGAAVMLAFSLASLPGLIVPLLLQRVVSRFVVVPRLVHGALLIALAIWIAARPFLAASPKGCHG